MTDVSKLKINNAVYNIKDVSAREVINVDNGNIHFTLIPSLELCVLNVTGASFPSTTIDGTVYGAIELNYGNYKVVPKFWQHFLCRATISSSNMLAFIQCGPSRAKWIILNINGGAVSSSPQVFSNCVFPYKLIT